MLVKSWGDLGKAFTSINARLDWELERQLGYHPLPTPHQQELIRGMEAAAEKQREAASAR